MQFVSRDQYIQADLVKLLYQQLQYVLWIESFVAICFVFAVYEKINHIHLLEWLAAILILCGLMRHLLLYYFRKKIQKFGYDYQRTKHWLILFCIGTFVSGIIWGCVGVFFIPELTGHHQILAIVMLMGAVAAANPICSASRLSYISYLLPAYLPFVIWQLMQDQVFFVMGILGFLYIVIMLLISHYTHIMLTNTFSLRYDNAELIADMSIKNHEVEKSLALTLATIQSMKDGVLVIDEFNQIREYNSKFLSMWSVPTLLSEEKNTQSILDFCQNQLTQPNSFMSMFKDVARSPDCETFDELHLKNGQVFERYSRPQRVGDLCVGHVWTFCDVTDKKMIENRLLIQANYDSLTGLPNRAMLLDRISQSIKQAKRNKTSIAIMFLDLDRFKSINDTLGHIFGDKLLRMVAERLRSCVRERDTVTRNGGDEFIILLNDLHHESDAIQVCMKCIKSLSEPFVIEVNKFTLTTSIGISFYPKDGKSSDVLIRHADIAMYRAKELGRNNFQFFTDEMNEQVKRRMLIESKLQYNNNDHFRLLYQPIVSIHTGKLAGAELFVQWIDPEIGDISPAEFVPVAEDNGLIVEIGDWMIRNACLQLAEWLREDLALPQFHIKLSARQFKLANLFERIVTTMQETALPPRYLALTLTESTLMYDIDRNIDLIKKMKEYGITIIIDNFGVGHSNLNYLKRIPANKIKVNQSFIKDVESSEEDRAIYAAIISLSHHLNLQVIADGVVSFEQLQFLMQSDCDELMGPYYSNPLSAEQFVKFMRDNSRLVFSKIT